jgi:entericidin A
MTIALPERAPGQHPAAEFQQDRVWQRRCQLNGSRPCRRGAPRFDVGFTPLWGLMVPRADRFAGRPPRQTLRMHRIHPVKTSQGATMKRLLALLLISMFSLGALSACNTMRGLGQDVQKVGEKVEDKAEDCKDPPC